MLGIKPQFPDGMRMGSDYHDVPYSLQAARGGGGGGQSQTRVGPTKFHHYPYPRESRGSGSFRGLCYLKYWLNRIIILIIIIISKFKEDNVFSMIDSLPYGPPVNTDIDYYRTFFGLFL